MDIATVIERYPPGKIFRCLECDETMNGGLIAALHSRRCTKRRTCCIQMTFACEQPWPWVHDMITEHCLMSQPKICQRCITKYA